MQVKPRQDLVEPRVDGKQHAPGRTAVAPVFSASSGDGRSSSAAALKAPRARCCNASTRRSATSSSQTIGSGTPSKSGIQPMRSTMPSRCGIRRPIRTLARMRLMAMSGCCGSTSSRNASTSNLQPHRRSPPAAPAASSRRSAPDDRARAVGRDRGDEDDRLHAGGSRGAKHVLAAVDIDRAKSVRAFAAADDEGAVDHGVDALQMAREIRITDVADDRSSASASRSPAGAGRSRSRAQSPASSSSRRSTWVPSCPDPPVTATMRGEAKKSSSNCAGQPVVRLS